MKKLFRAAALAAGILAVPALINHMIFKLANGAGRGAGLVYKWRYGFAIYKVRGEGEPLLLLHGLGPGRDSHEWDECAVRLARDFKVYTVDLPGFGVSDKPNITYSAYLLVSFIRAFAKDVIGRPAYVAAASESAPLALLAHAFGGGLFRSIILISPAGGNTDEILPRAGSLWKKWLLQTPIIGTSIYNAVTSRIYLGWQTRNFRLPDVTRANALAAKGSRAAKSGGAAARFALAAYISGFLDAPISHVFKNMDIPLRFVWGDCDDVNPLGRYLRFERLAPWAGLTVFRGAKQLPHTHDPKKFAELCAAFFR